jgi:hypothetical protein
MVIRVRLPDAALRHYLRPGPDHEVSGRVLTVPVRRETLVPAGIVLASSRDAGLVELPVRVDQGDMAQGLRPGDSVQVLAAYTEGARRGRAVVLLPSAEVVQVLQDPAGLAGTGQKRGVQLRMPSDRPRSSSPPSPPPGSSSSRPPARPPSQRQPRPPTRPEPVRNGIPPIPTRMVRGRLCPTWMSPGRRCPTRLGRDPPTGHRVRWWHVKVRLVTAGVGRHGRQGWWSLPCI